MTHPDAPPAPSHEPDPPRDAAVPVDPTHIVAVMAIVDDGQGRVLMIKSPRRGWEPPGGQVERGEDLIAALRREVQEETGIRIEVGRLRAVYSNTAVRPLPKLMLTFTARAVGGRLRPSLESPELGWFTPEEALALTTHPAQKLKLQDALEGQDLVYRTYVTAPFDLRRTESI